MRAHSFCMAMLSRIRHEARTLGVQIPKGLTAIGPTCKQYFVEAKENSPRVYIKADCAYAAKAEYISSLIEKQKEKNNELGTASNSR